MKTTFRLLTIACIGALCALPALAVELRNEDSGKTYKVEIHEGAGMTRHSSINGSTTQASVCSSCEIEVVGVGKAKVQGSQRVIIRGGKLTVQ